MTEKATAADFTVDISLDTPGSTAAVRPAVPSKTVGPVNELEGVSVEERL